MAKRTVAMASAALLWAAGAALAGGDLNVGDSAPALAVKEFVKGEPVKKFEKGKVYVVEFWATWCGPCKASIPHLTELQKKHKDVTFIGVSVWEADQKKVEPFVKEMGDKMDYRVAVDDVPEKGNRQDGAMAKTWMTAASQMGIPAAFVIDGDGKVAWVGHPMEMDKPLDQIQAGKWDLAAAAKEFKEKTARTRKLLAVQEKLVKAKDDPKERIAVLDQVIADEPKMEDTFGPMKFRMLAAVEGGKDKAVSYGDHLVATVLHDNAQALNVLAWGILDPNAKGERDPQLVKFALRAAQRADEVAGGKAGDIADTLAKAYFDNGDVAKAVETQERALKLVAGTPLEKDEGIKARLEQYKKALKKD